jgi:hypothetical protein
MRVLRADCGVGYRPEDSVSAGAGTVGRRRPPHAPNRCQISFFEMKYLKGASRRELRLIAADAGKIPSKYKSKDETQWFKVLRSAVTGEHIRMKSMTPARKHRIRQMRNVPRVSNWSSASQDGNR